MKLLMTTKCCYPSVLMPAMAMGRMSQTQCIPLDLLVSRPMNMISSKLSQARSRSTIACSRSVWIPKVRFCNKYQESMVLKNSVKKQSKNAFSSKVKKVRFDFHKKLPQDILIYSHKNDTFYHILSYFGMFQMIIWGYVSLFSFQQLKSVPTEIKDTTGLPWWKRVLYKEGQYKNALSAICVIVGLSVMFITLTYPRRAVRNLWLLRGADKVKITTYSWMGRTHTFHKPVEHLSCTEGRTGSGNYLPLKIKDTSFFYLLDKQGTFHNTELFDFVVGLKRTL